MKINLFQKLKICGTKAKKFIAIHSFIPLHLFPTDHWKNYHFIFTALKNLVVLWWVEIFKNITHNVCCITYLRDKFPDCASFKTWCPWWGGAMSHISCEGLFIYHNHSKIWSSSTKGYHHSPVITLSPICHGKMTKTYHYAILWECPNIKRVNGQKGFVSVMEDRYQKSLASN